MCNLGYYVTVTSLFVQVILYWNCDNLRRCDQLGVQLVGETVNACKILVGNIYLKDREEMGDNIKKDMKEIRL